MSHLKERLSDYQNQLKILTKNHQMILANDALDMVEQLIDDLEEDEKENGWTPVSERLPEDDTTVLVSCKTSRGTTFVRAGYCINGSWHLNCEGVKAWKPLPEPYKEEEKHETD